MTLEKLLIEKGPDLNPSEKIFIWDPIEKVMYKSEFWRALDDPIYEDIRKREAYFQTDRLFVLLKSQEKQLL